MEVMHNHQEALLTILEVLLYDPLNNWTISPQKAAALQGRRDRMDTETSELNVTMDIDNANTSAQGGSTFPEIIVTTVEWIMLNKIEVEELNVENAFC